MHPMLRILIEVSFVLYAARSLMLHARFQTAGFDLGIFDQVVRAYSQFSAPYVPLKGDGFLIWGDHFHPIIASLAPLYWIWDDPRTLLIAQAALVAVSVVPIWNFSRRRFSPDVAVVAAAVYVTGLPLQYMAGFDFHEIAFAVPLLAWAIDALDRDSDRELVIAAALLLLVREDMGALVAIIGIIRFFRRKPRAVGLAIVALGLVAFAVVVGYVIPHYAPDGFAYWDYPALGESPGEALQTIVTRPWHVIATFFAPLTKTATLLWLLVPLAFLPLGSPYAIIALPILAERFLAGRENLWKSTFHYDGPVWVIMFLAAVHVLGYAGWKDRLRLRAILMGWIAIAGTYAGLRLLLAVLHLDLHPDPTIAAKRGAMAVIPANTCVAAENWTAAHLTRSNRVSLPGDSALPQDFLVLDLVDREATGAGAWTLAVNSEIAADALADGWQEVFREDTILVLRSPDYTGPSERCAPVATRDT